MKTRQVTITNITYITPIQMDGPIVTPLTLSESIVRDLVRRGYNVYQEVDGTQVKLTPYNFNHPEISIAKSKPVQEDTKTNDVPERRFDNKAPVVTAEPVFTPKPEEPAQSTEVDYDFGKEVEAVDTSITPDEETVGRLFTGRPIPDVSPNVEAIAEVDISQEGTVEAGKPEVSETNTNNTSNTSNRLQNKRKHKR